jgi:hypothetical protein
MSVNSHHEFGAFNYRDVNSKRTDFSGLFRSSSRAEEINRSPDHPVGARRRRPREISPLQFEPEFENMDSKEEMSMEALHFFGLSSDIPSSTPATPKMFDDFSGESPNLKKRHRHFSLEDAMDESEDSTSSSNISGLNNLVVCSKRVRQNSIFFPAAFDDSAVSLSASLESSPRHSPDFFSNKFFSDSSMSLELDNDKLASQLRTELEVRLLETLCPVPGSSTSSGSGSGRRRKFLFELPPQLLGVIASHVLQEAANEPYGLKGCLLHIYYESETDCEFVASLDCDPETLSTFELTLTLRQDAGRRRGWRNKLPELVRSFSTFGFGSVLIGTSYRLVKRRNYRPNVQEREEEPNLLNKL